MSNRVDGRYEKKKKQYFPKAVHNVKSSGNVLKKNAVCSKSDEKSWLGSVMFHESPKSSNH